LWPGKVEWETKKEEKSRHLILTTEVRGQSLSAGDSTNSGGGAGLPLHITLAGKHYFVKLISALIIIITPVYTSNKSIVMNWPKEWRWDSLLNVLLSDSQNTWQCASSVGTLIVRLECFSSSYGVCVQEFTRQAKPLSTWSSEGQSSQATRVLKSVWLW
jgi:hypothetical protein